MNETALSSTRTPSDADQTAPSGTCDYAEATQEKKGKRDT